MDLVTLDMLPEPNDRIKMTSGDDNYEKYRNLTQSGFHHQYMRNMLHMHTGANYIDDRGLSIPTFTEVGQMAGISNTDWSWSALIADYDMDGRNDLFVTNGYEKDYTNMDFLSYTVDLQQKIGANGKVDQMEVIRNMPTIKEHNYIYRNVDGIRFSDQSAAWGMDKKTNSSGAIYADLDNDGDLDLAVNNMNAAAGIYRNNAATDKSSYLKVIPQNVKQAALIGSRMTLYSGDRRYTQSYTPVRGYQSSMQGSQLFYPQDGRWDSLVVEWNNGTHSHYTYAKGSAIMVDDKQVMPTIKLQGSKAATSQQLLAHNAEPHNDFKVQPLLLYAPSAIAPKIVSSTNQKYIYISGNPGNLYQVSATGMMQRINVSIESATHGVFIDVDNDGDSDLITGNYSYLSMTSQGLSVYINHGRSWIRSDHPFLSKLNINVGTMAAIDIDKDGDQDLFVGNRLKAEQYPQSNPSMLLINDGKGGFAIGSQEDIGMVTDAVVTDVDQDGYDDLVVSREWGTIASISNQKGIMNLKKLDDLSATGMWYDLHLVDVNKDGRQDIVAGNLGVNNQLVRLSPDGLSLYDYMFQKAAKSIPVLTITQSAKEYTFAARDELFGQIPSLKKKYTSYELFSKATASEIFGDEWSKARKYTAKELRSVILIHNGKGYTTQVLPDHVQQAPILAISSGDIDKDGDIDIILGGNLLYTRVRIGQMNSSSGSLLINENGKYETCKTLGLKGQMQDALLLPNGALISSIYNQGVFINNIGYASVDR
jgi:enediyne biosynthesis protein E4